VPGVERDATSRERMPRPRRPSRLLATGAAVALVAALAAGGLVLRGSGPAISDAPAPPDLPLLAFAEFGTTADHIYTSPANDPAQRTLIDTVPHAKGWGINPALELAGPLFAYTVLPTGAPARRDAPAEVWTFDLIAGQRTRIARDADLLVAPVLRRDGRALAYRRSGPEAQELVVVDLVSSLRTVAHVESGALGVFPIAFGADGQLLFTRLAMTGTDVFRTRAQGEPALLFHASDHIARDWRLSPDGRSLSFLAPEPVAERIVHRARVVAVDGARERSLPAPAARATEQYGPVWSPDGGALAVGQEAFESPRQPAAVLGLDGRVRALPPPARGFDVPLAWSADGAYLVVRSFDGTNSHRPGNASMVIVATDEGKRIPLSSATELIFIGWIGRA